MTKDLQVLSTVRNEKIYSGNNDSLGGKNTAVFRKMASGSRQVDCMRMKFKACC